MGGGRACGPGVARCSGTDASLCAPGHGRQRPQCLACAAALGCARLHTSQGAASRGGPRVGARRAASAQRRGCGVGKGRDETTNTNVDAARLTRAESLGDHVYAGDLRAPLGDRCVLVPSSSRCCCLLLTRLLLFSQLCRPGTADGRCARCRALPELCVSCSLLAARVRLRPPPRLTSFVVANTVQPGS